MHRNALLSGNYSRTCLFICGLRKEYLEMHKLFFGTGQLKMHSFEPFVWFDHEGKRLTFRGLILLTHRRFRGQVVSA